MADALISETSSTVDRLVIAVHRHVMSNHRTEIREAIEPLRVDSPGHLIDLADFLLVGGFQTRTAQRRFIYDTADNAGRLIDDLSRRKLLDAESRAAGDLTEVVETILRLRASSAAALWKTDLAVATRGASEALAATQGQLVDAFVMVPEPLTPAHRLHHLLTGIRYARMDAHIEAWQAAGLEASEIVALSASTEGKSTQATQSLADRDWMGDDGTITVEGRIARRQIEAATNDGCVEMFTAITDLP